MVFAIRAIGIHKIDHDCFARKVAKIAQVKSSRVMTENRPHVAACVFLTAGRLRSLAPCAICRICACAHSLGIVDEIERHV